MIEPAPYKLKIWRGMTFRKNIFMDDETGDPFDLSGYSASLIIQRSPTDATVLLTMNQGNGRITLGPDPGQIQLYISNTDTGAITWTGTYYRLSTTSPINDVDLILHGGVSVVS